MQQVRLEEYMYSYTNVICNIFSPIAFSGFSTIERTVTQLRHQNIQENIRDLFLVHVFCEASITPQAYSFSLLLNVLSPDIHAI